MDISPLENDINVLNYGKDIEDIFNEVKRK